MSKFDIPSGTAYAGFQEASMNVSLTRELESMVEERVRSGRSQSASEVVREALRLLTEVEEVRSLRLKELRKEIAAGLHDLDRGAAAPFDRKLLASIKARARRRLVGRER
jgi:antitoxin ParD1/3/4